MLFISQNLESKKMFIQIKTEWYGLKPMKLGDFDIACAEYCGLNHSYMYNKVKVMPQQEFSVWLNSVSQ